MEKYKQNTIKEVTKFFGIRFKDKDLKFEKKCGYFYTWCDRFENKSFLDYSDIESKEVWRTLGYGN